MRSRPRRLASTGLLCAFIALATIRASVAPPPAGATLRDLRGIEELKTWFNANNGHVRLILLLSPT
jgi:hypothetical protein